MAKTKEKNKALELRSKGESIKDIAERLNVAKGTVSLWCRNITLTERQIEKLHQKMIKGGYKGRIKGARIQHERRLQKIKDGKKSGLERLESFSDRDFFVSGIVLYWGEGLKKQRAVRFSNTDPAMIRLMIQWFTRVWNVNKDRFTLYVIINKIHEKRVKEVVKYWSSLTNIPLRQFTKTTLIKTKNKKAYKNFPTHYGTLTISIKKSGEIYYEIMGLIDALKKMAA